MLSVNGKNSGSWQDVIKFLGKCPICRAEFTGEEGKIFAKKANANLVHINCGQCRNSLMLMVVAMGQGVSSVSVVTDLSYEDAKRLYDAGGITLDEALEASDMIQKDKLKIV